MEKLYYVHIPKTAGASFKWVLKGLYEGHYQQMHANPPKADLHLLGRKAVQAGHTTYDKVMHLKDQGYKFIVFLRHPVERIISHYYYIKENKIQEMERDRDLVSFASFRGDFQKRFSGGDLEAYDFIGITDEFNDSMRRFSEFIDRPIDPELYAAKFNERHIDFRPKVSKEDRDKIAEYCAIDMEYYNKAKEIIRLRG